MNKYTYIRGIYYFFFFLLIGVWRPLGDPLPSQYDNKKIATSRLVSERLLFTVFLIGLMKLWDFAPMISSDAEIAPCLF